jgi:hypothetical protein
MRQKLFKENAISSQLLVDTQNDEEKSKLELHVARDRLKVFMGLDEEAIGRIGKEDGDQKARLALRCPVDGIVTEVDAELGSLYDSKSVLMVIRLTSSDQPAVPDGKLQ